MARTIYGEARSEPWLGQLAVGWIIRNRADHPSWWGSDVPSVCLKPFQFSSWNKDDPNLKIIQAANLEAPAFRAAFRAALAAYDRSEADPTNGATHYHTVAKPTFAEEWPPEWALTMTPTATVGAHRFYREA